MFTVPLTIVTTSAASTKARPRSTRTMTRLRSNRSAATPPMTPNSSAGRYWLSSAIETRKGSRVCEATSSGPAETATPSPTLLTNDADRSQRKLVPSLVGATVSMTLAGNARTGGRIPAGFSRRRGRSGCR